MAASIGEWRGRQLGRWHEATGGCWFKTGLQGLRLGTILWVALLVARLLAQAIKALSNGWGLADDHGVGLAWLVVLLAVCALTQAGRRRGPKTIVALVAVLAGLAVHAGFGLHSAAGYGGEWKWSFALGQFLPALLPAAFLLIPGEPVEGKRAPRRLWITLALVIALVPMAYRYEAVPIPQLQWTKIVLLGMAGLGFAVLGFFDPRAWFVPCVLVLGSTAAQVGWIAERGPLTYLVRASPFLVLLLLASGAAFAFVRWNKKQAAATE
jgi:hypothetical protein